METMGGSHFQPEKYIGISFSGNKGVDKGVKSSKFQQQAPRPSRDGKEHKSAHEGTQGHTVK
jgi:hypothetical protein